MDAYFESVPHDNSCAYCSGRRQNPLVHYLTEGWRRGDAPHPQFDGELYLSKNTNVRAAGVNPLEHFVHTGQRDAHARPVTSA